MNAIDWHPDGTCFIAGYRNGDVLLWKRGQNAPCSTISVSAHPNTPRRPVKKIFFTTFQGSNFICTYGGTSMSHEPDTFVLFKFISI